MERLYKIQADAREHDELISAAKGKVKELKEDLRALRTAHAQAADANAACARRLGGFVCGLAREVPRLLRPRPLPLPHPSPRAPPLALAKRRAIRCF